MKILEAEIFKRYGRYLVRNSRNGRLALLWLIFGVIFTFLSISISGSLEQIDYSSIDKSGLLSILSPVTCLAVLATLMYSMSLSFFQQWCIWKAFAQYSPEESKKANKAEMATPRKPSDQF
jgi:hypothetical protein